jgi:hypothetical protein
MANLANLFKFHYLTMAQYAALESKDASALYFIKDTGKIFKGDQDFTESVRLVAAFPETGIAQGVLYVNTATGEAKVYNGTAWTTVVRPVDATVTEDSTNLVTSGAVYAAIDDAVGGIDFSSYVTSVTYSADATKLTIAKGEQTSDIVLTKVATGMSYDGSTGVITLTDAEGTSIATANIPLDNFVKSGVYNEDEQKIVLTMQNGDVVEIPAADLVDVYVGGETSTVKITVKTVDGAETIVADVKVSAEANNALVAKEDGLFVDISGKADKLAASTAAGTVVVAGDAGAIAATTKTIGGATLADAPTADTLATEAAVSAAVTALDTDLQGQIDDINTDLEGLISKDAIDTDITAAAPTDTKVPSTAAVVDALSWKLYE